MFLRRHRGLLQAVLVLISFVVILRYSYTYYKDTSSELKAANIRHHELLEERNRFSRELEVMTQGKTDLEYSLKLKLVEMSKFRKECQSAKDNLQNQINRDKSESMARFNALDSEHRMVKANKDDLETEHKHLKKNFERLKADHGSIETAYKTNFQNLKAKNEKIISSLQSQVEYYQKQENSLSIKVKELKETVGKYQNTLVQLKQQMPKEKVSQTIEQGNKNAGPLPNKPIEDTTSQEIFQPNTNLRRERRRFVRHSKHVGGGMNTLKDVIHVGDEGDPNKSFESRRIVHHADIEKENNDAEEETKQQRSKLDNGAVVIEPVVISDAKEKQNEWKNNIENNMDNNKKNFVEGKDEKLNNEEKQTMLEDEGERLNIQMNEFKHANDHLNNDQKFDDQDVALQEGEENEDNAAEGVDKNEMLEN